jgi:hypothetical protein
MHSKFGVVFATACARPAANTMLPFCRTPPNRMPNLNGMLPRNSRSQMILLSPFYGARDVTELSGVLARIPQSATDLLVNLNDPLLFTARKLSLIVRVRCGFRQCTVKAYMPTMVG